MLKSRGPKIDPCGIPVINIPKNKGEPILVICLRLKI